MAQFWQANRRRRGAGALVLGLMALAAARQLWQATPGADAWRRWDDHMTYVYDLAYESVGEADVSTSATSGSSAPIAAAPLATHFRARLEETVWQRRPGCVDILVRLEPRPPAPTTAPLVCLAHLSQTGGLESLSFAAGIPLPQRQLARAVLAATQVSWSEVAGVTSWEANEADLTGVWKASYTLGRPTARAWLFVKQPAGGRAASGLEARRRGTLLGALDRTAGHLTRLAGEIETTFWQTGRRLGTDRVDIKLTLQSIRPRAPSDQPNAAQPLVFAPAVQAPGLGGEEAFVPLRQAAYAQATAGTTLEKLDAAFRRERDGTPATLLALAAQLEAFLALEPEAAAEVATSLLIGLPPGSRAFSSVAARLTYVGNAAAQDALRRGIAARTADARAVRALLSHLAMVAQPEDESVDLLAAVASDASDRGVVTSAQLGLGVMAHALLGRDPARAETIVSAAAAQLARGRDELLYLHILGNAGHSRQVEVVNRLQEAGRADLRAPALYSLRFVATEAAREALLAAIVPSEPEAGRLAATEALGFRPATASLVATFAKQLTQERSVPVLREVMKNLSRLASFTPEAKNALATFVRHCGHPDLCDFGESLLRTMGAT